MLLLFAFFVQDSVMRDLEASSIPESVGSSTSIGRDELNLAEFPIALLTDRASRGQKTLYFEDDRGRLTVTGSDAYGLPTAADADLIVALIYLTKQRINFRDSRVVFLLLDLIRLLNWADDGRSYRRLKESFSRWVGVSLHYDRCWWNNRLKAYTTAQMHIIESVELVGREANKGRVAGGPGWEPSNFTWNRKFIESCQADNLRQLDLDTYFSLKSAVSKRLYRFLGKRFHLRADWSFDLGEIAFERVGLSRSYRGDAGKIKEKLQPALTELEAIGFLEPLGRSDRFTRLDRGRWAIRLSRRADSFPGALMPDPELVAALVARGISPAMAADLMDGLTSDRVRFQLNLLSRHEASGTDRITDPAAWLAAAFRSERLALGEVAARVRRPAPLGDRSGPSTDPAPPDQHDDHRAMAAPDQGTRSRSEAIAAAPGRAVRGHGGPEMPLFRRRSDG